MTSWTERHLVNRTVRIGVRLGRDIDGIRELEVVGRRTGKPRRTPLKVLEVDGQRYLVSLNGACDWVRNLRSQNAARLRIGRRVDDMVATEIPDAHKPAIARAYLHAATRPETRRRLAWAAEGVPDAEVQTGAANVPIFRLAADHPVHAAAGRLAGERPGVRGRYGVWRVAPDGRGLMYDQTVDSAG